MIGIKHIVINDNEYSYRTSIKALSMIQNMTRSDERPMGVDMAYLATGQATLDELFVIIFCIVKAGMQREKLEFEFTLEEFIDELDEHGSLEDFMGVVTDIFSVDLPDEKKKKPGKQKK